MKKIKVWILGDSTAAEKEPGFRPETGWAEKLTLLLKDDVTINNLAKNGQSTKSFLNSDRFETFNNSLESEDYVIIQFGHNDQKINEEDKFTSPWEDYQSNLLKLIEITKQRKAYPILLTPVPRRIYNNKNQILDTFGDYLTVVRQLAAVNKVPLIDMNLNLVSELDKLTEEQTKHLYLNLEPGQFENYPNGNQDNTHFSSDGADFVAKMFAISLKQSSIELKKYFKDF